MRKAGIVWFKGALERLRAYREGDIDRALSFINDPEVSRLISTNPPFPFTRWDEEGFIKSVSAMKDTYNFAIETLEDGLYIGGCGINGIHWKNRSCIVGIMIGDPAYWGRGYGTDAMRVLLDFIFRQLSPSINPRPDGVKRWYNRV